ncbi:hypothetical protein [Pedobacter cryoconitis]|uniref:GLPGLI family protein n=1 Tax=Pedobacter cryoconitis TaxID=188932 RepID=A0A7X0MHJ5_9SPHI|nr:hypothetical protein [Pedobacter cryoconitis]MBB6498916.1 GLPGLI family protein [Pedobacter cryoconitis]
MKRLFIAALSLFLFSGQLIAQSKQSGVILFESTFNPVAMAAANGIKLSNEAIARMPKSSVTSFELMFNPTYASYMQVEETAKSSANPADRHHGGMRYGGLAVFGGGINREFYYSFDDQKLIQAFDLSDTTFLMEEKLGVLPAAGMGSLQTPPVIEYIQSDETKKILGFTCSKVIVKTSVKRKIQGEEKEFTDIAMLWYTDELGFDFSPNPALWKRGAVLAIEGKGTDIEAKSIVYKEISDQSLDLPAKGILITQDQFRAKMNLRRRQARLYRSGSWNEVKTMSIN